MMHINDLTDKKWSWFFSMRLTFMYEEFEDIKEQTEYSEDRQVRGEQQREERHKYYSQPTLKIKARVTWSPQKTCKRHRISVFENKCDGLIVKLLPSTALWNSQYLVKVHR